MEWSAAIALGGGAVLGKILVKENKIIFTKDGCCIASPFHLFYSIRLFSCSFQKTFDVTNSTNEEDISLRLI